MDAARFVDSGTVVRRCLGGLRFRDPLSGATVSDGLQVTAHRDGVTRPLKAAAGGGFALHAFPGFAQTAWPADRPSVPQPPQAFEIRVADAANRFHPVSLRLELPAWPSPDQPYTFPACHDAADGPWIDLLSLPSRATPPGFQAVRGELCLRSDERPARWAWLAVYRAQDPLPGPRPLAQAMADEQGRFCLLFPLPLPDAPTLAASASATYSVRIEARFDTTDKGQPPDLCKLRQQPVVALMQQVGPSVADDVPLPVQVLRAGQPLVLRSNRAGRPPGSLLFLNRN